MKLSSLYPSESTGVNRKIDGPVDISPESGEVEEPVSVADFHNYARLMGFENDGESGELDFTSDDAIISSLITGARQAIEVYTGLSLVAHTWRFAGENGAGDYTLPFSNQAEITEFKNCQGEIITDFTIRNVHFLVLTAPLGEFQVTYETPGYCPERLKTAILAEALYRYENRGDEKGIGATEAIAIASTFKQVHTWLA